MLWDTGAKFLTVGFGQGCRAQSILLYTNVFFEAACECRLDKRNATLSVPTLQGQPAAGEAGTKAWVSPAAYGCRICPKYTRLWDSQGSGPAAQHKPMCVDSAPRA